MAKSWKILGYTWQNLGKYWGIYGKILENIGEYMAKSRKKLDYYKLPAS